MKKRWIGFIAFLLLLSIGAVSFAQADVGMWNFRDHLPYMKQMHPNLNEQQLEGMFNNCHGKQGMMGPHGMMKNGMVNQENYKQMMRWQYNHDVKVQN